MYGNEPETFTVAFLSSFASDTSVKWYLNNRALVDARKVNTEYHNESFGTTSLVFSPLTRVDKGRYTLDIRNSKTIIPADRMTANAYFVLNVVGKSAQRSHITDSKP